jgi:integrase
LGEVPIGNALEIKAGLEKITTIYQTKRALIQLSAACKWGLNMASWRPIPSTA